MICAVDSAQRRHLAGSFFVLARGMVGSERVAKPRRCSKVERLDSSTSTALRYWVHLIGLDIRWTVEDIRHARGPSSIHVLWTPK